MTTVAGCHQIHIEDRYRYYLWLGDYLARLEDKDRRLEGKEAIESSRSATTTRPSTMSWWHR
jgi:hypothetical protein